MCFIYTVTGSRALGPVSYSTRHRSLDHSRGANLVSLSFLPNSHIKNEMIAFPHSNAVSFFLTIKNLFTYLSNYLMRLLPDPLFFDPL